MSNFASPNYPDFEFSSECIYKAFNILVPSYSKLKKMANGQDILNAIENTAKFIQKRIRLMSFIAYDPDFSDDDQFVYLANFELYGISYILVREYDEDGERHYSVYDTSKYLIDSSNPPAQKWYSDDLRSIYSSNPDFYDNVFHSEKLVSLDSLIVIYLFKHDNFI